MATNIDTRIAEMIAICRAHSAHALEQCMWYVEARQAGDENAWQYAGNPDLVAALGHFTADRWLELEGED